MMCVHHAGDSVKSETIKHVNVHIESQIREEESQDLVMTVIEQSRVPKLMSPSCTVVEVLVIGTVKYVDPESSATDISNDSPVKYVLASVRVDDIQKHGHAHLVSLVNERLELLRCACIVSFE